MNQPYMLSWDYPTQYDPYPRSYDYKFQNNFSSSQSQWGFNSPESNFQPSCLQFSQYPFPNFASYTPFSGPLIEEKSKLEKSIKVVQAMLESQQKKLNSPISQYFHDSSSVSPIKNNQPSTLKTSRSAFMSLSFNLITCWTHNLHYLSKTKILILSFWTIHLKKNHI